MDQKAPTAVPQSAVRISTKKIHKHLLNRKFLPEARKQHRRALSFARGALPCLLLALACAGGTPAPEEPTPAPRHGDGGSETLLQLGEQALARGELDTAEDRFGRVLAVRPLSVRARVGVGRIALARGEPSAARNHFEQALAVDPEAVDALVGLADVEVAAGRPTAARDLLERAVRVDFGQSGAHGRLMDLTGRAPPGPPLTTREALEHVEAHPYDPRTLTEAGARLAAEGHGAQAVPLLKKAVWLADLDPRAAGRALTLLPSVDPAWEKRRAVPVRVFADETLRAQPHWDFRMRLLWLNISNSLDPVLATRFVPVELRPLYSGKGPLRLEPWYERFRLSMARAPAGIVAAFTERPLPQASGAHSLGLAEFLGRYLVVRLEPGRTTSRVLAHEILHLYGAVHVSPELESLMNPTGKSRRLDAANQRIARAVRDRSFLGIGLEGDVLAHADLDDVVAAYEAALAVNMLFRNAGIAQALRSSTYSRPLAARKARRATRLDPHLADVSRMLARLMLADGRRGEALLLLDSAARLYGNTPRGREARAATEALARELEALYGEP
jgi:tetratricopeptide (TPR) repeat protein